MQMRLWRGRARLGYAMRFATPRHVELSRAELKPSLLLQGVAVDVFCTVLPLPTPVSAPASSLPLLSACLCLLLMMPTEMLGLPLLLIALLHLTISGLRFACQMSSCGGSTPPPHSLPAAPYPLPFSLHRKLPSHLPTATLYANYFCQCAG